MNLLCNRQSYPQLVWSQLIDIGSLTRDRFIPETKFKQQLVSARQQHLPPLASVVHELLQRWQTKATHAKGHLEISTTSCINMQKYHNYLAMAAHMKTIKSARPQYIDLFKFCVHLKQHITSCYLKYFFENTWPRSSIRFWVLWVNI